MRTATQFKSAAKAYNGQGEHTGPGAWLDFIHAVNALEPGTFGASLAGSGDNDRGDYVEKYADFDVIHLTREESVIVVPTTDVGIALFDRVSETF